MLYLSEYDSLLGKITLGSNGEALTALWLPGQTCAEKLLSTQHEYAETPAISEAKRWLDIYFSGREPDFFPALAPEGTAFQLEVWNLLRQILWQNNHLRRACRGGGKAPRQRKDVRPSGGKRRRQQSHFHNRAMPSGGGRKRQPYRL